MDKMADANMDMDMDMDVGEGEVEVEIARLNAEAAALEAKQKQRQNEAAEVMKGIEGPGDEAEVDMNVTVAKVHVYSEGLEQLHTRDLGNYAREHYSSELFRHVQWVNDTSANLVYDTEIAATEALQALSTEEVADPGQLRSAKRLSTHPAIEFYVRMATELDVKVKNAYANSRYYLMNPEVDPEKPHGHRRGGKRRFGERGYRERDYSHKRRRGSDYHDRYSNEPFDVDLYDDKPEARERLAQRMDSYSSGEGRRRKVGYSSEQAELFPDKDNDRLRNRSASPGREGSGLYGFAEDQPRRRTARPRSPTSPRLRASTNRAARDLLRKELFPDKNGTSELSNGHANRNTDLFPKYSSPAKDSRELFPSHKRQDARDIDNEYIRKVSDSIDTRNGKQRDMFERMGIKAESSYGRLAGPSTDDSGYTFKGAGGGGSSGGFSILGASREKVENPLVKELFPTKNGEGSKDLFDGRIKGRGKQKRSQAEDLF